jgi:hypothetical protein
MKTRVSFVLLFAVLLGLSGVGCTATQPQDPTPALSFETQMQINAEQEWHISLGVHNEAETPFAGDKAFHGQMKLWHVDGNRAGELRASASLVSLAPLAPDETAWPLAWRARLDPGTYSLTWGAEGYGLSSVEFRIVERDGRLYLDS